MKTFCLMLSLVLTVHGLDGDGRRGRRERYYSPGAGNEASASKENDQYSDRGTQPVRFEPQLDLPQLPTMSTFSINTQTDRNPEYRQIPHEQSQSFSNLASRHTSAYAPHFEPHPLQPTFTTPSRNTQTHWNLEYEQSPQEQYQPFLNRGSHSSGYFVPQFSESPPLGHLLDSQIIDEPWNLDPEDAQRSNLSPYYEGSSNAPGFNTEETSMPFSNILQPAALGQYNENTPVTDYSARSAVATTSGRQSGSGYGPTTHLEASRRNPVDASGYASRYGDNTYAPNFPSSSNPHHDGSQQTFAGHSAFHNSEEGDHTADLPLWQYFADDIPLHDFKRQKDTVIFQEDTSDLNAAVASRSFIPDYSDSYPSPQIGDMSTNYDITGDDLYPEVWTKEPGPSNTENAGEQDAYPFPQIDHESRYDIIRDDFYSEADQPFMQRTGKQTIDSGPSHTEKTEGFSGYSDEDLEYGMHCFVSDFYEEETRPQDDIEGSVPNTGGNQSQCIIPIRQLPRNHGILMRNGMVQYPVSEDRVVVDDESYIEVHCGEESFLNLLEPNAKPQILQVHCKDKTLTYHGRNSAMEWKEFNCSSKLQPKLRLINGDHSQCVKNLSHYQVGFTHTTQENDLFHVTYNLCVDRNDKDRIVYTWNYLDSRIQGREKFDLPEIFEVPKHGKRSSPYYLSCGSDKRYNKTTLMKYLSNQIGIEKYRKLTKQMKVYIGRGLLVSDLDFVYRVEQATALHYLNVQPMWSNLLIHWSQLQIVISNYAAGRKEQTPLTIHTGTTGHQTFPNEEEIEVSLYAHKGKNDSISAGQIPKYFYKRVYDPSTHKCVFLIGNNSGTPFRKACPDVSGSVTWLKGSGINTDLLYACNCGHFKPNGLPDIVNLSEFLQT